MEQHNTSRLHLTNAKPLLTNATPLNTTVTLLMTVIMYHPSHLLP